MTLDMEMRNFQPESRDISARAHAKKWSNCIYIAITFEILVQNR